MESPPAHSVQRQTDSSPKMPAWSDARVLVGLALVAGLLLRLVGLSQPPYDDHSFRQTQTLSTIEAFHAHGIDLLHPRAIYMGDPGVFVLELPVFQALAACLYDVFGPHLEVIRILNILMGAATTWLLYRITLHFLDRTTAILTALIYWLAPLNIIYQRSMLLDPTAVFFGLLAFYCLALLAVGRDSHGASDIHRTAWFTFIGFVVATWFAAMIKALYLWPVVLLLAKVLFERRFKVDGWFVRILSVFAVAGVFFLAWNYYAAQVNDASPFTRGVKPTSLLGMSDLFTSEFYHKLFSRPKWWLGGAGILLFPVGLVAAWLQRQDRVRAAATGFMILIPPTYLLAFANINRPHDYYQLIITPFLAVVPAIGLRWLAARFLSPPAQAKPIRYTAMKWIAIVCATALCGFALLLSWEKWHDPAHPRRIFLLLMLPLTCLLLFAGVFAVPQGLLSMGNRMLRRAVVAGVCGLLILSSVLTYRMWLQAPKLDRRLLKFEELCTGKVLRGGSAMVFVAQIGDGDAVFGEIPQYIYAAKLWGFGMAVQDAAGARGYFEKLASAFPRLEYVVFYGTDCPDWLPSNAFRPAIQDGSNRLYIFQRVSSS